MVRVGLRYSVVTRLAICLVGAALAASVGLGVLELRRAESVLQLELTQRVRLTAGNIEALVGGLHDAHRLDEFTGMVQGLAPDVHILAARLSGPQIATLGYGDWPANVADATRLWVLNQHALTAGNEVDRSRPTLVRATIDQGGHEILLEMIVDGPAALRQIRAGVFRNVAGQWLIIGLLTLVGLVLSRQWFTGPLSLLVEMIGSKCGPDRYYRLARQWRGEFAQMASAIGGMLCRLENTADQLRRREKAFEHLYQFAPAAMLSLDPKGRIIEANRRAGDLFARASEKQLIGVAALDLFVEADHAILKQAIDRLALDTVHSCNLRTQAAGQTTDVHLECTAVRGDEGQIQSVRLAVVDISPIKSLQQALADKGRLMDLILNHMSDAILLVDAHQRVAAHNQQLGRLLQRRPESLTGASYDPQTFWDRLGVADHDAFVRRLRQIEADRHGPAQQDVDTRIGNFLFQGMPVDDETGRAVGRLWVVAETTSHQQSKQLIDHQARQLKAVKRMGLALAGARSVHDLMTWAGQVMYEQFAVDAVGLALRDRSPSRGVHVLHRGNQAYLLEHNRALVEAIQCQFMRQVMASEYVTFWPDLTSSPAWADAFQRAGLTCVAAAPLHSNADVLGIIWMARRSGQRLERYQIHLLEALAPMIAARVEFARLREDVTLLDQTDQVTDLPNIERFVAEARRLENRPGYPWSVHVLDLDHFRRINDALGHSGADLLLREVASTIARWCRRSNLVGRLEGPRFGVLCQGLTQSQAKSLADRLLKAIGNIAIPGSETGGSIQYLSASIGVATSPEDGTSAGRVLATAADRVDAAKQSGRNGVVTSGDLRCRRAG